MNEAVLSRDFEKAVLLRQRELQLRDELQKDHGELTDEDYARFPEVTERDMEDAVASWTGIPVSASRATRGPPW